MSSSGASSSLSASESGCTLSGYCIPASEYDEALHIIIGVFESQQECAIHCCGSSSSSASSSGSTSASSSSSSSGSIYLCVTEWLYNNNSIGNIHILNTSGLSDMSSGSSSGCALSGYCIPATEYDDTLHIIVGEFESIDECALNCCETTSGPDDGGEVHLAWNGKGPSESNMFDSAILFDDNKVFTEIGTDNFKFDHWVVAWIEYSVSNEFIGAVLIKRVHTCYWPDTTINNDYLIIGSPTFGHSLEDPSRPSFVWQPSNLPRGKCPCSCDCENLVWAKCFVPINFSSLSLLGAYGGHYWEYIKYIANITNITSDGYDGPIGPTETAVGDTFRLTDEAAPDASSLVSLYPSSHASLSTGSSISIINSLVSLENQIDNLVFDRPAMRARRIQQYVDAGYSIFASVNQPSPCCGPVLDMEYQPFGSGTGLYCYQCDQNLFPHILRYPNTIYPIIESGFWVANCDPDNSVVADGQTPFSTYFAMHDVCASGIVRQESCEIDHVNACGSGTGLTTVAEYGFVINGNTCGYRTWGELDGNPELCPCSNTILPSGTVITFSYTSYCDYNEAAPCDQLCEISVGNHTYDSNTGAETAAYVAECNNPVSYITDGIQTFESYFNTSTNCSNGYAIGSTYFICTGSTYTPGTPTFKQWDINGSICWYRPDGAKADGDFDSICPCMSEILPAGTNISFIGEGSCNDPTSELVNCYVCELNE